MSLRVASVWFMAKNGVELGPFPYKPIGVYPDGGKLQAQRILLEVLDGLKARGEL